MQVIELDGVVINVESNSPLYDSLIQQGATILPDIFGKYAHIASNENTYKEQGAWVFKPNLLELQKQEDQNKLSAERNWVEQEMLLVQVQIDYIADGDYAERTNFWGADEVALRAYRVALKNYISADGTINGDRPARP